MKRLVLIRHGESAWNAEGRVQGQSGTGLSARGVEQAQATAREVEARWPDAMLWVSDMQRALETCQAVVELLGTTPVVDQMLRERSFGRWEGHLRDDVIANDGDRWQRWMNGHDVIGEVGGETADQLSARVHVAVDKVLGELEHDGVAVLITHGGVIWHGVHRLAQLPSATLAGVHNTSVTELLDVGDDGRLRLSVWNSTGHLPPQLRGR